MKPLLVIPPSPARWPAVETLFLAAGADAARIQDLSRRYAARLEDASDAMALIPSGGLVLAAACIRRRGTIGVLGDLFVREDHRKRGLARSLLQTLLSWFDMTGGKWLLLASDAALAAGFFEHFGFAPLHRCDVGGRSMVSQLRILGGATHGPLDELTGGVTIRTLVRADFPLLMALGQYLPGPDPRVAQAEAALTCELTLLDLLAQKDRGTCELIGAEQNERIVGLASVAVDQLGKRTYAMLMPHSGSPRELRDATVALAAGKGYETVDFPLEVVAGIGASISPG
jgi:GNAT superfamily N-acetyltransferase